MEFIKANQNAELKFPEICFDGRLDPVDVKQYKDQLNRLERVSLSDYADSDVHNYLLKHCPNLTYLGIETSDEGKTNWMSEVYPHLKSISFCFGDIFHHKAFAKVAKQFFEHHQKVKDIKCSSIPTIKSVLENVRDIERLILQFENFNDETFKNYLMDHFRRNPVKWFGLDIQNAATSPDSFHHFNSVQPIHELKIGRPAYNCLLMYYRFDLLTSLVNLSIMIVSRKYTIMCCQLRNSLLLRGKLLNLETFEVTISTKQYEYEYNPFYGSPVPWKNYDYLLYGLHCNGRKLRKLKYRIYSNVRIDYYPRQLIEWNADRMKIPNATPIDIELEYPADYIYDIPEFTIPDAKNRLLNLKIIRGYRMSKDDEGENTEN